MWQKLELDNRISSKKARIIFLVPNTYEPQQVQEALYEAISFRADNLHENENFFPETLPEKPGSPKTASLLGGKFSALAQGNPKFEAMSIDTSNAFYTVIGDAEAVSPVSGNVAIFQGAIYPYKEGYKVYLYLFYQEGSEGLIGSIVDKISKSMVGEKDIRLVYIAQARDEFLTKIPDAKIVSQFPFKLAQVKTESFAGGLGRSIKKQ